MSKPIDQERELFEAWRLANFCGGHERLKKCSNAPAVYYYTAEQEAWKVWQARAAVQPAGEAVQDAVLVGREWLCELQKYVSSFEKQDELRAILASSQYPVSVPESMRSAAAAEMNRLGYGHHESHAESILIAAGALHPVSGEQKAADGWISPSERLPDVHAGGDLDVLVAVRRAHNGKVYVFTTSYLNRYPVLDHEQFIQDDDNDHREIIGWFYLSDDEETWHRTLCQGDELVAWQLKPAAPGEVVPTTAAQDVAGLVEALEEIAGGRSSKSDPYIARQALAAHRAQQGEQSS